MRANIVAMSFAIVWLLAGHGITQGQSFQFVHPPTITADDFSPPDDTRFHWKGPFVQPLNSAKCWYAEPDAPDVAIGGSDDWQKVVGFIPTGESEPAAEYRQPDLHTFAGGGAQNAMKATDMPPGLFLSFKAHPVWRIMSVAYPAKDPLAVLGNSRGTGVLVTAEFLAAKTMGECFIVGAAWIALPK